MTGRKGRVVQTDAGIQYESRSEIDIPLETLNLTGKYSSKTKICMQHGPSRYNHLFLYGDLLILYTEGAEIQEFEDEFS